MSEGHDQVPTGKFDSTSPIRPSTVNSNSDTLEDGEIAEGHFPSNPPGSWKRLEDGAQSHRSKQLEASIPPLSTAEPVTDFAPIIQPMTMEDLDRAKSLVLDLLGWGVSPEYLVECGLSPGAIHAIFTDLRLRLPSNAETFSLPPTHHSTQ